MGKKYQRSKLADTAGIGKDTLRYYESRSIITPSREPGNGYRLYSGEDLTNLIMLKIIRSYGYSLEEASGNVTGFGEENWERHLCEQESEIELQVKKLERIKAIYGSQRCLSKRVREEPAFLIIEEWNDELCYIRQLIADDVYSDEKTNSAVKEIASAMPISFYGMKVGLEHFCNGSLRSSDGSEEYGCFWWKSDSVFLPTVDPTLVDKIWKIEKVCRTAIPYKTDNDSFYAAEEQIFCLLAEKGYRITGDIVYRILPQSADPELYFFEMIIPIE